MWYAVDCEPKGTGEARSWIKYAFSSDGQHWTIKDQPVISPQYIWDKELVTQPAVIKIDGKYKMWFSGRNSSGKISIGYADSNDGITWTRLSNPVIVADKIWELSSVAAPEVPFGNNHYTMYYHSSEGNPHDILYAISMMV